MPTPPQAKPTLGQALAGIKPEQLPRELPLQDLHGMRSELLDSAWDAMSGTKPNRRLARRLYQAANAVDDAIDRAIGQENVPDILRQANKFYKENVVPYRAGGIGKLLAKGPKGEFVNMDLSQIPGRIWNKNALSTADDFIKLVGPEEARDIMRGHAAYDLMQSTGGPTGNLTGKSLNRWLSRNKPMLEKFGLTDYFDDIVRAQKASDAATASADEFERTVARNLLDTDPERAIETALAGRKKAKAVRELMYQVGHDQAAVNGMRKSFGDFLMGKVQKAAERRVTGDPTSVIQRVIDEYEPAMRALYRGDPAKMQTLRDMQRAYEIAARNKTSTLGGESATAENMLSEIAKVNVLYRGATIARGLYGILSRHGKQKANEYLTRALFNHEYAETIKNAALSKISPKEFETIINGQIMRMRPMLDTSWSALTTAAMATGQE